MTTLKSFQGGGDSAYPNVGLVQGSDGNFYGTTAGGNSNANGYGTVFKITPAGVLTTLYSFTGGSDGGYPRAGLVQGSDGNFYGTTTDGGANTYYGTIFKITPEGVLTTLYSFTGQIFTGSSDGGDPTAALVQGSDGNFYGTTEIGGDGSIFQLTPAGVFTNLYTFTGGSEGRLPTGSLSIYEKETR